MFTRSKKLNGNQFGIHLIFGKFRGQSTKCSDDCHGDGRECVILNVLDGA